MRLLYTALFYAAAPWIILRLLWRSRGNAAYRYRIGERFGFYEAPARCCESVWIHAVSVGETESAAPLIRSLREQHPGLPLLVTTTTPTGSARVQALFGDSVEHCYLPYDLPDAIARFLKHFRPRLAVIMETEIWPNLFAACAARAVPLVIVNARLSRRSANGYRRAGAVIRGALASVSAIAAQTPEDAERYVGLGAEPGKVTVTGNIKFDVEPGDDLAERGRRYRQTLFGARPVVIVASTHAGEEEQLLSVFRALRARFPGLLLVLVPRHPERFGAVAALCRMAGYPTVLRSQGAACRADDAIFVLDSMGELRTFYAAADVAFVGGSLVPVGGHNVLEPALLGLPVVFGPHVENFRAICDALVEAGGAIRGADAPSVGAALGRLLAEGALRQDMGQRGRSYVLGNRGALARVDAILADYLVPPASKARPTG